MSNKAKQLNHQIVLENKHVYDMLSLYAKQLYYPSDGILSQSAEAKNLSSKFNATIGIATEKDEPMYYEHIQNHFISYEPNEIYPYAPPEGNQKLRKSWKNKLLHDNTNLHEIMFSLPIVTSALSHGLTITANLFIEDQDTVILPNMYWENYNSILRNGKNVTFDTYPLFNKQGGFNCKAFKKTLYTHINNKKVIVVLNFPNNPTGYTPNDHEMLEIKEALLEVANKGLNIVVVLDDAYFGLFYENPTQSSIFGNLIDIHPRIFPIKIDGATKENFAWGLRIGFITFGTSNQVISHVLEEKVKGIIRSTISSSSNLSQTIILHSLQSNSFHEERKEKYVLMKRRATKVKEIVNRDKYKPYWTCYPFNSGYFICLQIKHVHAETLRKHLLKKYQVGVVSINATDVRIAFSSVDEEHLEELFDRIHQGIIDLSKHLSYNDK